MGHDVPSWRREEDFDFDELSSEERLTHSQVDKDLVEPFQQKGGEQEFEDGWLYERRSESIEELLKNGKISPDELDDIIYRRAGLKDGEPKRAYAGQSAVASSSRPKSCPPSLRLSRALVPTTTA